MVLKKAVLAGALSLTLVGSLTTHAIASTKKVNSTNSNITTTEVSTQVTSDKAKETMLAKVPGGKITEFKLNKDDNTPEYEGTIIKGNYEYEIDVNVNTGKITKFEKEKIAKNNKKPSIKVISEDKAKKIMINKVQGGEITEFKLDKDDNTPEYEGTIVKDNYEYEIELNAKTGKIIKFEKEKIKNQVVTTPNTTESNGTISVDKAKEIMLTKVPGGKLVEFEYDKDDRTPKYEGTIIKGNYEYEIEVNAKTGKIIDFDKDLLEEDDD